MATFERKRRATSPCEGRPQDDKDPGLEVTKSLAAGGNARHQPRNCHTTRPAGFEGFTSPRLPGTTAEKAGLKPGDFITAVAVEAVCLRLRIQDNSPP